MLVVADINTRWRSRPFEALSELRPVLGLQPMDPLIAVKQRRLPGGSRRSLRKKMRFLSVVLPFRWATRSATKALPQLWMAALKECRSLGEEPSALVVTSPHYAPLVQQSRTGIPTFYYCSDDYSTYAGWDAAQMREQESDLVRNVSHSFFVSNALRNQALREYAVDPSRTSVSMNATDEDFLTVVPQSETDGFRSRFRNIKSPVAGIIGGINDRLDFDLIGRVANQSSVGSVVLVGPIAHSSTNQKLATLRKNPKCIFTGPQPHATLSVWLRALDVALIPYKRCLFNTMCSPMRLFDHLAAGRPIVATSACDQVNQFGNCITVAEDSQEFVNRVTEICKGQSRLDNAGKQFANQHTWIVRGRELNEVIRKYC